MNCLLVMKIKWSLYINTGAVERSEAARARSLAGATVGVPYAESSVFYKKCTKTRIGLRLYTLTIGPLVRSGPRFIAYPHIEGFTLKCSGECFKHCWLAKSMGAGFRFWTSLHSEHSKFSESADLLRSRSLTLRCV